MGATQLSLRYPRGFFSVRLIVCRGEWMVIHRRYVVTDPLIHPTLVVPPLLFRVPCHAITFWLVNQRSSTASFQLVNLSLIGHGFNQLASTQIASFYLHLITVYLSGNFVALRVRYLLLIDSFECNKRQISITKNHHFKNELSDESLQNWRIIPTSQRP